MHGSANKLKTSRNIALTGAVSGNVNFDGSGNAVITTTQTNIAVLSGTINPGTMPRDIIMNYPTGFDNTNSVLISSSIVNNLNGNLNYSSGSTFDLIGIQRGGFALETTLRTSDIVLRLQGLLINDNTVPRFVTQTTSLQYKIVLMKIR